MVLLTVTEYLRDDDKNDDEVVTTEIKTMKHKGALNKVHVTMYKGTTNHEEQQTEGDDCRAEGESNTEKKRCFSAPSPKLIGKKRDDT